MRVIHWSMLHFVVARNQFIKVILGKKTCQLESVEHVEKFVEASHYLKRRGRKVVVDRVVAFAVIICTVLCSLSPISFYLPINFLRLTKSYSSHKTSE